MKHLKSSGQDLRTLFTTRITVKDIAEAFVSFDAEQPAVTVRQFMEEKDFDVVGVRQHGVVVGYVQRSALELGTLSQHLLPFGDTSEYAPTLPDTAPLIGVFKALGGSTRAFVKILDQVGGIVTRGDLQKAPVRMYLFGLISLIEMQLLRIIRQRYPQDEWQDLLTAGRLDKAREILEIRRLRNEAIDLADCLQYADKVVIMLADASRRQELGFTSKGESERLFRRLQELRDNLAHVQAINSSAWPETAALVQRADELLDRLETM